MAELLVSVKRGEQIESRHFGNIAVVDYQGKVLFGVGDCKRVTFARSTLKPIQALPLVELGAADHFSLTEKEIALCCASHRGEKQHTQTAVAILHKLGLTEADLQCGAHPPYHSKSYEQLLQDGGKPTAIHNNCSGKHAGLLATSLHLQSDIGSYHLPEHPVQQKILATLGLLSDLRPETIRMGIDGCGVPTFALPLANLALIFARLAEPKVLPTASTQQAVRRIVDAMVHNPEMVGGTEVFDTDLMQAFQGKVVAKVGAEGVYGLGIREKGIGIAVKIEDGNARALPPVVMTVLDQLGLLGDTEKAALHKYYFPEVKNNRGEIVGWMEPLVQLSRME